MKNNNNLITRPKVEALKTIVDRVNDYGLLFSDEDVSNILGEVIKAMSNLAYNENNRTIH